MPINLGFKIVLVINDGKIVVVTEFVVWIVDVLFDNLIVWIVEVETKGANDWLVDGIIFVLEKVENFSLVLMVEVKVAGSLVQRDVDKDVLNWIVLEEITDAAIVVLGEDAIELEGELLTELLLWIVITGAVFVLEYEVIWLVVWPKDVDNIEEVK